MEKTTIDTAAPKAICLPASASPIVSSLRRSEEGFWITGTLPAITEELHVAARICVTRVESRLAPADPRWVRDAVAALLVHFFTAKLGPDGEISQAVYRAVAQDWAEVLDGQPSWAIAQARVEWLRTETRKPKPADILRLCNTATSRERALLRQCASILAKPITPPEPPERMWADLTADEQSAEIAKAVSLGDYGNMYLKSWGLDGDCADQLLLNGVCNLNGCAPDGENGDL